VKIMAKLTLKKMILNEIDNGIRGYSEELAKISGYSSGSALKKVLRGEEKEFEQLQGVIKIVEHIWGNDSIDMMVKFSNEVDPNKKTARNLLEYLAVYREFEAFNSLLEKMELCKNKESNEWSKIYKMQYKYELANTKEDYRELLKELNDIHVTFAELKAYKKMLMTHCFNQLDNFIMFKALSEDIKFDIEAIDNSYIKESYTIRLSEVMSYNYLRVYNNPVIAREYADKIISSDCKGSFKAYAYYIKGFSYLFSSYDEALTNLSKSKELYNNLKRKNDVKIISDKIEFVNVYWGKLDENKCFNLENKLLMDIKNGKSMTLSLDNAKGKVDEEFLYYLDGCNSKSNKKLILSLIKYIKKNDLFLANLAKIELLKNGYDEDILNELIGDDVN
jgi:hypothetical protein